MIRKNQRNVDGKLRCGKCGILKEPTDFYKNKSRRDGYAGHCKMCESLYPARKLTGNGQKKNKRGVQPQKRLVSPTQSWTEATYRNYKQDAKKRGREFLLTLQDVKEIIFLPCSYCGGFTDSSSGVNGIDRIDNSKDYVRENCAPCCAPCNHMKFQYDLDFFMSHVIKIARKITTY